ncbi:MAG: glycosyltransferase [Leptospiraceae bacterium]|nr:glycosyltransferase [Leptospiraceae bacterium]
MIKSNSEPLVSVIIATYNSEKYLEECILSILNQKYNEIELIIIDGKSKDKTLDIIKKYKEKINYWVSEFDLGIYDAWNKGLKVANGSWISFIGSDDFFDNNAIANYVNHINTLDFVPDFVSSKITLINENKKIIKVVGKAWVWNQFKRYMSTLHVGMFHNKNLFEKYGYYNLNYRICADYELLLRPKNNLITSFLPLNTCFMRIGGISNKDTANFKEVYKIKTTTAGRFKFVAFIEYFVSLVWFKFCRLFKI